VIGIYAIKERGRYVYVGQSNNINRQWGNHKNKRYGDPSYELWVIKECLLEELDDLEEYYIAKYDTFHNGDNQTPYAQHRQKKREAA